MFSHLYSSFLPLTLNINYVLFKRNLGPPLAGLDKGLWNLSFDLVFRCVLCLLFFSDLLSLPPSQRTMAVIAASARA